MSTLPSSEAVPSGTSASLRAASSDASPTSPASLATPSPPWVDRSMFPWSPRRHATPDGDLSYIDVGEGPTVLFVHGTPSWSFEWRHVIREVGTSHRCIAVDHLGMGLSSRAAAQTLRVADHAARLAHFVEALDLRDITLVVHDFGGPIGLPLAVASPSRVARVVAINTWCWPTASDPAVQRVDRLVRGWFGSWLYLRLGASARWLMPTGFHDRTHLTTRVHAHYLRALATPADRVGTLAFARELAGADGHLAALWSSRDRLGALPMAVVWGRHDRVVGRAYAERWREAFPDAAWIDSDAGHFVAEEDPAAIVRAIRQPHPRTRSRPAFLAS